MDAHALPLPAATLVLPRKDAGAALLVSTAVVVDTVAVPLVAATATTDTVACLHAAADTRSHTLLVTLTTDTALPPVDVPSHLPPCAVTLTTATDEALPLDATTPLVTVTISYPLPAVALAWTTHLVTFPLAALPATTRHLVATATCRHPLPAVEGTTTCPLPLLAQAAPVVDIQMALLVLATTTLARLLAVTK